MKTWVLCFRLRNGVELITGLQSRRNGLRVLLGGSANSRPRLRSGSQAKTERGAAIPTDTAYCSLKGLIPASGALNYAGSRIPNYLAIGIGDLRPLTCPLPSQSAN